MIIGNKHSICMIKIILYNDIVIPHQSLWMTILMLELLLWAPCEACWIVKQLVWCLYVDTESTATQKVCVCVF